MFKASKLLHTSLVAKVLRSPNIVLPGIISPPNPVPPHIQKPPYVGSNKKLFDFYKTSIEIKNEEQIEGMRKACKLARQALQFASELVKPGVTTDYIDKQVHEFIIKNNAYPSPLGYGRFPKSICTSVNEVICHGIPDDRALQDGDVINIDVTVYYNGYHGDTSKTFCVGNVSDEARDLIETCKRALYAGIKVCRNGVKFMEIGEAISKIVVDEKKYTIFEDFCGHGIGSYFHGVPQILHFRNMNANAGGVLMRKGMTFTIEPIIGTGPQLLDTWCDGQTFVAKTKSIVVQEEHTVLVLEDGVEILTADEDEQKIYKVPGEYIQYKDDSVVDKITIRT